MNNNSYDFCIQSPKWQRNTFFGFLIFGGVGPIVMTILWLIFQFDWGILVGSMILFAFPLFLAPLGLYVWYKEKFLLKDGTFTYIKPFKNSQSAKVEDLLRVEISLAGIPRVTFIGKNGEKLISFLDDGTCINKNVFVSSLMHYDIPIVRN